MFPIRRESSDLRSDRCVSRRPRQLRSLFRIRPNNAGICRLYQNIPPHPRSQISLSSTLTSPTTPTPQYPSGAPFQFNKPEAVNEVDSGPREELFPEGEWASSFAQLAPETTLAYWQITGSLALVSLVRSDVFETKRGLIEYNVAFFRDAVQKIQRIVMSGGRPV
ncbi:hypothetical protein RSAG8_02691, partial [Rhizoctonia solani AG-8 WAC10335]